MTKGIPHHNHVPEHAQWSEFIMPWDDTSPGTTDMAHLLHKPAGAKALFGQPMGEALPFEYQKDGFEIRLTGAPDTPWYLIRVDRARAQAPSRRRSRLQRVGWLAQKATLQAWSTPNSQPQKGASCSLQGRPARPRAIEKKKRKPNSLP
jgi:hypothetical protein